MNVPTLLDGLWPLEIKSSSSSEGAWQAHCLTDCTSDACTEQPDWVAKAIFHHLFLSLCHWPMYWSADWLLLQLLWMASSWGPALQALGVWTNVGVGVCLWESWCIHLVTTHPDLVIETRWLDSSGEEAPGMAVETIGCKRWIEYDVGEPKINGYVGDLVGEIMAANREWKHSWCLPFYLLHMHKHEGIVAVQHVLCAFSKFFFPVNKQWQRDYYCFRCDPIQWIPLFNRK